MEPRRLTLERLSVRTFRNLRALDVEPGPRFNVLSGDNGHGKTNVLDAAYTLATSKSFRTAKNEEAVMHGELAASVKGRFVEDGSVREQHVGLERGRRALGIDGKRPKAVVEYAARTPVVLFHPGDTSLPSGGGSERRRLLDRIALYLAADAMIDLERHTRAARERQVALEQRGTRAADLEEWEELMVRHGTAVRAVRRVAAEAVGVAARRIFAEVAGGAELDVAFAPSAPEDREAYRAALEQSRAQDLRRGAASVGPHRDDLVLSIDKKRARGTASQGQSRLIVLALKSAELEVICERRGVHPILLLDDVSSELDPTRTQALFGFLARQEGQVFLTTTRRELIDTGFAGKEARRDFRVRDGTVTAAV